MLIKGNGAIKFIMNKNVRTNKLNFRTKIMNKTNFSVLQENIIDKTENRIKENNPINILFAQSALLNCSFEF